MQLAAQHQVSSNSVLSAEVAEEDQSDLQSFRLLWKLMRDPVSYIGQSYKRMPAFVHVLLTSHVCQKCRSVFEDVKSISENNKCPLPSVMNAAQMLLRNAHQQR